MHGVPLCARNACVSLFAVSPLMRMMRVFSSGQFFWIHPCTSAPFTAPGIRMSEITPAYLPFESRCNPSAPDEAFTTAYPLRSSAARRKAVTDGSSSMSRIGPPVHNACCVCSAFIALLLSSRRPQVLPPSLPESAPQKFSPLPPHFSSTTFPPHPPPRRHNQCSVQAPCPCPPAWLCKTDQKCVADRQFPSHCR